MALNQEMGRNARHGPENEFVARPVPFLVGLWRQLGADPALKRSSSGQPELFAALQSEIIPRLLIANRQPDAFPALVHFGPDGERVAFTPEERVAFMDALLSDNAAQACSLAETHLARGHAPETILMDLFAWSARELGELWNDDRVSFVDVTIGVSRLHETLHRISEKTELPAEKAVSEAPSILIAIAPGEQHIFGVLMAAELFRKQGWIVTTDTSGDPAETLRLIGAHRFDMAGLSVSHDGATDGLSALIMSIRKASKNPALKLVAGGQLFEQSPHIAQEIGADGIAGRGLDAPELARNMLAMS